MADLNEIAASIEIAEVKARYCRCLDTKDWEGFASVFTEDLEMDTRPSGGELIHGRDAFIASVRGSLDGAITAHQIHSPEITIRGDEADVIWAMQDRVLFSDDKCKATGLRGLTGYGHYHEHYVRRDGRWRIARQTLTRLHMDMERVPAA